MNKYTKWLDIHMAHHDSTTPSFQSLRPGNGDIIQFIQGHHTRLAVHTARPYGVLSDGEGRHVPGLLDVVESGDDYTVFDIPEEALALKALTLGTGSREAGLLDQTYRSVGQTVTRVFAEGVEAPDLSIDDIAIGRETGAVYLIPPIDFMNHQTGPPSERIPTHLLDSLEDLQGTLADSVIGHLRVVLDQGAHHV